MTFVWAPVNIAVIKYWGKRDSERILPVNSSLSLTLHGLRATTGVVLAKTGPHRLWLNGIEEKTLSKRILAVFQAVEALVGHPLKPMHILSKNNFPTAAGLASSAAGYAALALGVAKAQGLACSAEDMSKIARVGSGSASRSLFGGFARWSKGEREDGADSFASLVAPVDHWPTMRVFVLVVSDHKKEHSSTSGQQTSVATSLLLAHRAAEIVDVRMKAMEQAIAVRDFESFARITMQDSNQFHAVCLDTYPPIFYLNETSRAIIRLVTNFNEKGIKAAYTFDAGPNAVLFVEDQHAPALAAAIRRTFPAPDEIAPKDYFDGYESAAMDDAVWNELNMPVQDKGSLRYIISTRAGEGAQEIDLDLETEFPEYKA